MAETLTVTIGGQVIALQPILTFDRLKRAWPAIKAFKGETDEIALVTLGLRVISAAIVFEQPDMTPEALEKRLLIGADGSSNEMPQIVPTVYRLLLASGFKAENKPSGEVEPA